MRLPPASHRSAAPITRDRRELAAIFAGGFVGTVARAELSGRLPLTIGQWPWATFAVNVVGAFVLGCVAAPLQQRPPRFAYQRPLLGTGLCGGLTTFSTMQLEIVKMLDAGDVGLALGYAAASIVAGFLAVAAGTTLVRRGRR